jgi:SpoVK/Ycf46/Vps4 family AAA+-type ATPase
MEHLREISKIAEWGLKGDKQRLAAYLDQLIEKVESLGDERSGNRLRRISEFPKSEMASSAFGSTPRIPVDSESRLSLADEEFFEANSVQIVLDKRIQESVDEFVSYVENADALEKHGVGVSPSLITYGIPGTGKTQLARHIACRLKRPLVTARADTLISSFLGSTSKNIRTLFDHVAHRHCILFLDEIDAFAKLRDDQQELGELKRVVVSLLQNIDAMDSHTIFLAATNHEHMLDPAIWRRFTFKINITLPSCGDRKQIFNLFLNQYASGENIELFADLAEEMTGADIRMISENAIRDAVVRGRKSIDINRLVWRIVETRLKRSISPEDGKPEDIIDVKNLSPSIFKGSTLAELFQTSESTISRKIKQANAAQP